MGLSGSTVAAVTAVLNALTPRPLARLAVWLLLLAVRPALTSARLERLWRWAFLCDPAAGPDPQAAFSDRFLRQLQATGSFRTLAEALQREGRWRLARRLEALARFALLTSLRQFLLEGGSGPSPLTEVQLATCGACDLRCQGCYSAADREPRACDGARVAYLVDEAARQGAAAVHFLGKGEPLLDEGHARALFEVAARRPHLLFTLTTNGVRFTPALARLAARAPNLLVLVSVDGPEAIHDGRRGPGIHSRALGAMRLLREEGVLFGFSCTAAAANAAEATAPSFVASMRAAGCCLGVYSRHFSVGAPDTGPWTLSPPPDFLAGLEAARAGAGMPLFDLDELEGYTGCRARAGLSVYVDGLSGQVAPCIKVPRAPAECRLLGRPGELGAVLAHPFFAQYRSTGCAGGRWCGADLAAEQRAVAAACADLAERAPAETPP